jgi:hypothetical protein
MKYLTISFALLFSATCCYSQSKLTEPESGCEFALPWTCNECIFNWTGSCVDKAAMVF